MSQMIRLSAATSRVMFPERCVYCGAPRETDQNLEATWRKTRYSQLISRAFSIPYCLQHAREMRRNVALLYAIFIFSWLLVFALVAFYWPDRGNSWLVGLISAVIFADVVAFLAKMILARLVPFLSSLLDTPMAVLISAGPRRSLGIGVAWSDEGTNLVFKFANPEIAQEFEQLNKSAMG